MKEGKSMHLYFDLEEKYERSGPYYREEWSPTNYPLFSHLIDLINLNNNFWEDLLLEYKSRMAGINKALSDFHESLNRVRVKKTLHSDDIIFRRDDIMKEIQTTLNKAYNVNLDLSFYWICLSDCSNGRYPFVINEKDDLFAFEFKESLDAILPTIDEYIDENEPLSLEDFYMICEVVRSDDEKKIFSQYLGKFRYYDSEIWEDKSLQEYLIEELDSEEKYVLVYKCENALDILLCSLFEIVKNNYYIKKCIHCGKYFVPLSRSDEKYCLQQSPTYTHLNCKEAGKYTLQLARERSSGLRRAYKSIYTMKQYRANNSPLATQAQYREELRIFMNEADAWKAKIKAGNKTEEEFAEWLNSFKRRGKKNG